MELKCRCHGVSGSCELKTCWRTLPSFAQVGQFIKDKYENSIQISAKAKKRLRRRGKVKRKVPVRKEDLVHIHKSPNYCVEDSKRGILGTTGRQCNKTSIGKICLNFFPRIEINCFSYFSALQIAAVAIFSAVGVAIIRKF